MQRSFRGQADEIPIAFFVFGEHQEVVVLIVGSVGAVILSLADVEFAAEDGLDPLFFGRLEEVNCPVDISVVGHGDGFLPQGGDPVYQFRNVAGAVEEGVLGVQMEVGEFGHG